MSEKVLFVDDETNVLDGLRRSLRGKLDFATAASGAEGLGILREEGPFAVVVSDMRMPEMDGVAFLARVAEEHPDCVRMILSGQADLESAIEVVNRGHIFRFLTKPCPAEVLIPGVEAALRQHRLVVAERELLEQTLRGAVNVLTEILGLVNPGAFSRASRVRQYAEELVGILELPDAWQIGLAATLSQIGCVTVPAETLAKLDAGEELTDEERAMYDSHPGVAGKLLASIPRLEAVARIVAGQAGADGESPCADDPRQWQAETVGGQVLRAAIAFDRLLVHGKSRAEALAGVEEGCAGLHPIILAALRKVHVVRTEMESKMVTVSELTTVMVLDEDVTARNGVRVLAKGQEVTFTMLARLRNFAAGVGIKEPFRVLVPR